MSVCSNADPTAPLHASGFHARQIDGVECGLFSIHAPLGQTTLCVRRYPYDVMEEVEVRVTVCGSVCEV